MAKAKMRGAAGGLRMTRQRRAILEAVAQAKEHPTADEVYRMARRRLPRISLGTVYRNLETLAAQGLIQELAPAGRARRFDGTTAEHYHVHCVRCGRVADARMEPLKGLERAARRASDYEILGHRLEFVGLCPRCARQEPRSDKEARKTGGKGRRRWS